MNKIDPTKSGIAAVKKVWLKAFPGNTVAFTNFANTQSELVSGHNETFNRLSAVEGRFAQLPFLYPPAG
jgi:hypothetical protein